MSHYTCRACKERITDRSGMKHKELAAELRQRINPAYAHQPGTESFERRECAEAIEALVQQLEAALKDRVALATRLDAWESQNPVAIALHTGTRQGMKWSKDRP